MNPMTHERCSELLAAYIQGGLAASESAEIRTHLGDCDACRGEEAGLRALMATETGPLTESERSHLRAGVMAAVSVEEAPSLSKLQRPAKVASVGSRTNWKARGAGMMAAAAGIILVAGLFYLGSGGLSGQDEGADDAGDTAGGDTATNQLEQSAPLQDRDEGGGAGGDATEELNSGRTDAAGTTASGFAAPLPAFIDVDRRRYTRNRLQHLGERGLQLVLFRRAYRAEDARRLQEDFVERLAVSAARRAGETTGDQVRDCATIVLSREETVLPAFGALGRFEGDDVLVLGFAWSEDAAGRMDRYMLWTWPRGSCDSPLDYRSGTIKPAN